MKHLKWSIDDSDDIVFRLTKDQWDTLQIALDIVCDQVREWVEQASELTKDSAKEDLEHFQNLWEALEQQANLSEKIKKYSSAILALKNAWEEPNE